MSKPTSPEHKKALGVAWRAANRERLREQQRAQWEKHKPKRVATQRACRLIRKFGITVDQYESMLTSQSHGCGICGGKDEGRRLCVDHCHTTGEVRGSPLLLL